MADKENKEILNPRENNKTNREKREQEERQIKMLKLGGMIVLGVVVVAVLIGIILGIVNKPSKKVVATVGDEKITLEEFQEAVRLQRSNINNNYQYVQQMYSMFGMEIDSATRDSYASQMSDAYKGVLGQTVLSNMIDQRVMAYGAAQEGISVSDDEVETYYRSMFGYYPDGTPTSAPTDEPFEATPTVSEEQLAILRYTETPAPEETEEAIPEDATEEATTDEVVEEAAEVVEETVAEGAEAIEAAEETVAEVVEDAAADAENAIDEAAETVEDAVEEVAETVEEAADSVAAEAESAAEDTAELVEEVLTEESEPTEEPTPRPTATVMSEDVFKQYETVYFANNYYFSKDYMKKELGYELLQQRVEDKIKTTVPRSADMVWARHILVATEEEAKAALERINNGEEWGDVAAEVSTDSTASNGGDLGWFTEGTMVQPFNDAAFSQEVGTISEPVQTDFGWHLIQVIAHEEHPYTSTQFNNAVDAAYQEWLNGYSDQLNIEFETNVTNMTPTDPAFIG